MARLVLLVLGLVVCTHVAPGYGGGKSNNEKHVSGAAEDVKGGKYGTDLSSGVGHDEAGSDGRNSPNSGANYESAGGGSGGGNGKDNAAKIYDTNKDKKAGSDVGNTPNSGANSESARSGEVGSNGKVNAGNNHGISKDEGVSSDDRITPASGAVYGGTGSGNEANVKDGDISNNANVGKSDTYGNSGGSDSDRKHANIEDAKSAGRFRRQLRGQGNQGGRGGIGGGRGGNDARGNGRFRRSEGKSDDNSSDSEESSSESDEGTNTATDKHDKHGGSTSGKDADNRASYIGEKKGRYRRAKSGGKGGKKSGSGKCG